MSMNQYARSLLLLNIHCNLDEKMTCRVMQCFVFSTIFFYSIPLPLENDDRGKNLLDLGAFLSSKWKRFALY